VADVAVQGCVEVVGVAGEPGVEELEEFGELDGVVGGEVDARRGCCAFRSGLQRAQVESGCLVVDAGQQVVE
jgi:hypothetical protein